MESGETRPPTIASPSIELATVRYGSQNGFSPSQVHQLPGSGFRPSPRLLRPPFPTSHRTATRIMRASSPQQGSPCIGVGAPVFAAGNPAVSVLGSTPDATSGRPQQNAGCLRWLQSCSLATPMQAPTSSALRGIAQLGGDRAPGTFSSARSRSASRCAASRNRFECCTRLAVSGELIPSSRSTPRPRRSRHPADSEDFAIISAGDDRRSGGADEVSSARKASEYAVASSCCWHEFLGSYYAMVRKIRASLRNGRVFMRDTAGIRICDFALRCRQCNRSPHSARILVGRQKRFQSKLSNSGGRTVRG